jgi:hypothetical protein
MQQNAVVVTIPGPHILGQSIGCVVPLRPKMRLGRLRRICTRLSDGSSRGRVSINLLFGHTDMHGWCISIAFHLAPSARPISDESFTRRIQMMQQWLRSEFGIREFNEKNFPDRIEFCKYLCDPLTVM